jgi:SAM-dependent methyltransferase
VFRASCLPGSLLLRVHNVDHSEAFEPRPEFERYAVEGLDGLRALAIGVVESLEHVLAASGSGPVERIIDVGAGSGSTLRRLHERGVGSTYVAVDVQARLAEAVHRALPDVPVQTLVVDTRSLPFDDHEFDLALLSHVIEHIPDPRAVIHEAGRVARLVYIEVPLEGNALLRFTRGLRSLRGSTEEPGGHVHRFTSSSLERTVAQAGLSTIATNVYYPERLLRINDASAVSVKVHARRLVSRTLGPRLVAHHYNGFAGVLAELAAREPQAGPDAYSASRS